MNNSYDFLELKDNVIFTFYTSPKETKIVTPELLDSTTLLYNDVIKLEAPVSLVEIKRCKYKVEVILKKQKPGKWKTNKSVNNTIIRNYDAIDNETNENVNRDIYDILSDIYAKGDDNVKRAMNKSMIESKGTILSTNWNEVSKDTLKPQ